MMMSWRTQLCRPPSLIPNSAATRLISRPARTRAAARARNSDGYGFGMFKPSQEGPSSQPER